MKTFKFVLFLTCLFAISGCVSKKKYQDLESAKKRSDLKLSEVTKENKELETKLGGKTKEANKLNDELDGLKKEFNDIKNEMLENNASKTSRIEELNRKLSMLSSDHKRAKDSLQNMLMRLDKRDQKYKERAQNLSNKISELDGIDAALQQHANSLLELEKFVTHNLDKNNISSVYTEIDGGFLYVTFDPNTLFKKGSFELEADGKRILKILDSAIENNQHVNTVVASKWAESEKTAWDKTSKRANVVVAYLLANASIADAHFSVSNERIEDQKTGENTHEIALILFPPLNTIAKFAD